MKISNLTKKILGSFLAVLLVVVGIVVGVSIGEKKSIVSPMVIEDKSEKLRQRFDEMIELENKNDYEKIYDNFLSEDSKKKVKRDMFVNQPRELVIENKKVILQKRQVNDLVIKDNIGYVDNTIIRCFDNDCVNNNESRMYADFVYENNNWFDNGWSHIFKPILCVRDNEYEMPEEFKRSISLIIQRLGQTNSISAKNNSDDVKKISNCLNIQYANSEREMNETEGFFTFKPSQSLDSFDIKISPKYSAKDDLLTTTLLAHEIQHAIDFAYDNYSGIKKNCFNVEARAFTMQNNIITAMNAEERSSLASRALIGSSVEATQIMDVYFTVPKFKGKDYSEKALNFVKSSSFYQKQCGTTTN